MKTININYRDNIESYVINAKELNKKIPVTIHKYNYNDNIFNDIKKLDLDNKIDLFISLLDNAICILLEALFYIIYKVNLTLFFSIGKYRQKRWYIKTKINFDKQYTDEEINEFALCIEKDFTDSQIKEAIRINKGIILDHWRIISKIKTARNKYAV